MRPLRSFLKRRSPERRLLVSAVLWLAFFRIALWIIPFRVLKRLAITLAGDLKETRGNAQISVRKVAWAIDRGRRRVPYASCLTQALAAQVLMGRYGYAAEIHIGVMRDASNAFAAHAWVMSQGEVLVGGEGVESYRPIAVLGGARR